MSIRFRRMFGDELDREIRKPRDSEVKFVPASSIPARKFARMLGRLDQLSD